MMSFVRYFFDVEDRVPCANGVVTPRGAIVNGAQSSTAITVHAGHGIQTGDKVLYALNRKNVTMDPVYTVATAAATTLTFAAAVTVPDQSIFVTLGADTGATQNTDGSYTPPNWDGSTVTVYKDPAGDSSHTNATVPKDPGGEIGFWGNGSVVWVVCIDHGRKAHRIYPDIGPGTSGMARVSALPASANDGDLVVLAGDGTTTPDIVYQYLTDSTGVAGWTEAYRAS